MTKEESAQRWNALLFDIPRSIRYHERRLTYYERLHRATDFLTILLAGVVLSELLGSTTYVTLQVLAGLGAFFSAWDLVIGYARRADMHRNLRRRFTLLQADLTGADQNDDKALISAERRRLQIEAEEPQAYRALDVLCHNELCRALGKPGCDMQRVPFFLKVTANLLRWNDYRFEPLEPEPETEM